MSTKTKAKRAGYYQGNSDDLQHILFNVKTSKEMGIISLILPARKLHEHTNKP